MAWGIKVRAPLHSSQALYQLNYIYLYPNFSDKFNTATSCKGTCHFANKYWYVNRKKKNLNKIRIKKAKKKKEKKIGHVI